MRFKTCSGKGDRPDIGGSCRLGKGRVCLGDPVESGFCRKFGRLIPWCTFAGNGCGDEHMMIEFKGSHFERDVILWAVRWYVAYPITVSSRK